METDEERKARVRALIGQAADLKAFEAHLGEAARKWADEECRRQNPELYARLDKVQAALAERGIFNVDDDWETQLRKVLARLEGAS